MAKQIKGDSLSAALGGSLYLRGLSYGIRETGGQIDIWINSGIMQAAFSVLSNSSVSMATAGSGTFTIGGANVAASNTFQGGTGSQFGSAGSVTVTAGANTNNMTANLAGSITISGGAHASNNAAALGGDATLRGGAQTHASGVARAGNVSILGGNATGSGSGGNISITGGTTGSGTAGEVIFTTAGSERMRILAGGPIQINNQGSIRFLESGSTNYVAVRASAAMSGDYTITLPAAAPAIYGALVYDGTDYIWQNVYNDQEEFDAGNSSTNLEIDWDDSLTQVVQLTDDWIMTQVNARSGNPHTLVILQDSTPRTITWDTDIDWGANGAPDISALTVGQALLVNLLYLGSFGKYLGSYAMGYEP